MMYIRTMSIARYSQAPSLNASAPASRSASSNRVDNGGKSPTPQSGLRLFGRPAQPRVSPQAARVAALAKSKSLPWALPKAREQDDSGMKEQREALDKMMGGGSRCGCLHVDIKPPSSASCCCI